MKFVDIFAGIGTIRMGMEQAGHECVYSIEFDKHKRGIYNVIFGNEPEGSDIRGCKGEEIPTADLWSFGFPCQDISVAGKQLGFTGERSSLFFEVMRLLSENKEENRPKYLLVENVKNFFSVNGGRDFLEALYQMDALGYDAEWQLINSKNHGVPQNRERIFIIGHLRGRSTRKVFPIRNSNSQTINQVGELDIKDNDRQKRVYSSEGISPSILARSDSPKVILDAGNQSQRVYSTNGISCTLKALGGGQGAKTGLYKVKAVLTPDRAEKRQNGRRMKEDGEPMFTLTGQDRHGIYNGYRIRRLTPKECFRLQGFPDEYFERAKAVNSDSQLYKEAGNSVTITVVYEIAKRL